MNELRWSELAAQVVAWHNRNPLARRIGVQHVHSLGYVMLPFAATKAPAAASTKPQRSAPPAPAAPEGHEPLPPEAVTGSLRERAMARAQLGVQGAATQTATADARPDPTAPTPLRPAFTEDFIPPHTPKSVRRWAARHAVAQTTPRGDVQVRKLTPETGLADNDVLPRWALTAQIEIGQARSRVLVGPGAQPAVLGRRLISPARGLVLLVLVGALLGTLDWVLNRPAAGPAPAVASPALPAASASASASASATAVAPPAPTASAVPAVTSAPAPASSVGSGERPPDVEPRLGKVDLPSLGPRADERRRRAQEAAAAAAASAPATAQRTAPQATPHATPQATPPPAPIAAQPRPATAPPPTGPSFAVATRLLRTRSESEQVAAAMRELLSRQPGTPVQVDVLAAGEDWRVVGWPYTDRALADKAQALLASRGMKVQVIDF